MALLSIGFLFEGKGLAYTDDNDRFEWTRGDTALLAVSSTLIVMDWAQTVHMARNPHLYEEHNPVARVFLGRHPSPARVTAFSTLSLAGNAAVGYALPSPWRKSWFSFWIVTEGFVVKRGYDLGIGASFRF